VALAATTATAALATLAAGGLPGGIAADADRPGCRYRVRFIKTRLNIRDAPGGEIVDKLYPGDHTWGSCKKVGKWRRIHGTDLGRRGFAHGRYLKKIGRR
jgi:hypothetical protein